MERYITKKTLVEKVPVQPEDNPVPHWPHLTDFFTVTNIENAKISIAIACTKCKRQSVIYKHTLGNIKRHYKSIHPILYLSFLEAITHGSKRGARHNSGTINDSPAKQKQPSIGQWAASGRGSSQDECNKLFAQVIIHDMLPINFANSPYLKAWVLGLNPDRKVQPRQTLMRSIHRQYDDVYTQLKKLLETLKYISTTSDCWTSKSHRTDYLGMTAHYLVVEEDSIVRKSAILVCRE
ncbi:unnamed protein product, partial [Meganyctiphanes norvegica]